MRFVRLEVLAVLLWISSCVFLYSVDGASVTNNQCELLMSSERTYQHIIVGVPMTRTKICVWVLIALLFSALLTPALAI